MSLQGFTPPSGASKTGIITGSTPSVGGARLPLIGPGGTGTGGIAKKSTFSSTSAKQIVSDYRRMTPAFRKALSQKLKDAGYQTPVTGEYSGAVRQALLDAYSDLSAEITYLANNDPAFLETNKVDLNSFLGQRSAGGGGGERKPSTYITKTNIRPETLEATIDEVVRSYTGRGATAEEIAKWSEKINTRLAKPSSFAETTYTPQGETTTFQEVTPAFSPKEYLFQQIAKTDEAKANKVFGFYNAFKRALGVS